MGEKGGRDDRSSLERYLHEQIPLTRAMEVGVRSGDESHVVLTAPLGPNINHRETAFGGSVSTLGILAAWTLLHLRLGSTDLAPHRIVIQRGQIEFLEPIHGAFQAVCRAPDPEPWSRFLETIRRMGMGRIRLEAEILQDGEVVGRFSGDYVALPADGDD